MRAGHLFVHIPVDGVIEYATGSDHQRQARKSRKQKDRINISSGGQKKSPRAGNQVPQDDPRFGDKQIIFYFCKHAHIIR